MYNFYLDGVLLPVAPEKLSVKIKNANKTMTLINEGEVNFLREAGLTEIDFDAFIPSVEYAFADYDGDFKPPAYFLSKFKRMKTNNTPFKFIVTRETPDGKHITDTNMLVSLESYTIKEQAQNGLDFIVSLKLKQYRSLFYKEKAPGINPDALLSANKQTSKNTIHKYEVVGMFGFRLVW